MRVLLIEDEPTTAKAIELMLTTEGFNVYSTDLGEEGLDLGKLYDYDIICLDLNLPDMHGYDVLKKLRTAKVGTPVLILSGVAELDSKVRALGFGADDYVTKPFRFEEVLARVQALLRRSAGWSQPLIRCGAVTLDTRAQEVRVADEPVELTAFEYRLLEYLMLRAGQVVSKTELTEKLYEQDFERDSNTIEVFIGRLRRKLDPDNRHQPIETLRGRGYRISRDTV
jgi:two-component system cell cycle response regulator CtrA